MPSTTCSLLRRWRRGVLRSHESEGQRGQIGPCADRTEHVQTGQTEKAGEVHATAASAVGPLADATGSRGPGGPGLLERLQRKLQDSKSDKLDLAVPLHAPGTDDPHENAGNAIVSFEPETKMIEMPLLSPKPTEKEDKEGHKEDKETSQPQEHLQPESMTDEELKDWMLHFGLKPSSSREFMIRRLHDIVDYLEGGFAWLQSIREAPTPAKAKRKVPKDAEKSKNGTETPKATSPKAKVKKVNSSPKARSKPKAASPKAPASVSPEDKHERRLDLVADAIRKDKDLWEKLLIYQQVDVQEVKRRIVAIYPELRSLGEQRLRKFLVDSGFASAWAEKLLYVSECLDGWLKVQRVLGLDDYLETKRGAFARFYFLSNVIKIGVESYIDVPRTEWVLLQPGQDYGMRAVKTVIEAAGLNKRQYPDQSEWRTQNRVERPQMDYGRFGQEPTAYTVLCEEAVRAV
eukprot:Skav208294  [mRNA]  locus=scaffold897:103354:114294:+ [translate_table: standard]